MKLKDAKYFGIKLSPHRIKNDKGQLIVTGCEFARTGEQKYHSSELTNEGEVDKLNKFIYIKRPVEEVSDPKTVASFEGAPVTEDHPEEDVKVGVNYDQLAKGFATNVKYIADSDTEGHLQADFIFTDADLIKKIENNEINELSAGYNCDVDEDTWVCRHIRGNHIAVVSQARAGHQARLLDKAYKSTSKKVKTLKIGDKLVNIVDSYSYELEDEDGSRVTYTDYYTEGSNGKKKFLTTLKDSVNKTVKYAVPESSFKDVEALINKCKFDIKNKEEVKGYTQFEVVGDAEADGCWKDLDAKVKDINFHKNVVVSKDSKSVKDSPKFMGAEPYYLDDDTLIIEIGKYVGGEYRKLEVEMWLDEGNSFHYNVANEYDAWTATDKEVKDFGVDKSEIEKFMLNYSNKDIKVKDSDKIYKIDGVEYILSKDSYGNYKLDNKKTKDRVADWDSYSDAIKDINKWIKQNKITDSKAVKDAKFKGSKTYMSDPSDECPYLMGNLESSKTEKILNRDIDRNALSEDELWATGWTAVVSNKKDAPFKSFEDIKFDIYDNEKGKYYNYSSCIASVDKALRNKFLKAINDYLSKKSVKDSKLKDDSDEEIYARRRELDKAIRDYFKDKPEFEVEGFYNGNDSTEGSIYVVDYYRRRDKNSRKPKRADSDSFEDYVEELASYVDDRCAEDLRKIPGVEYVDVGVADYDSSESINVDIQIDCENVTR